MKVYILLNLLIVVLLRSSQASYSRFHIDDKHRGVSLRIRISAGRTHHWRLLIDSNNDLGEFGCHFIFVKLFIIKLIIYKIACQTIKSVFGERSTGSATEVIILSLDSDPFRSGFCLFKYLASEKLDPVDAQSPQWDIFMLEYTTLSGLASYLRVSEIIRLYIFNVEALFVVPYISQLGKCETSGHCHSQGCQVVKEVSPQEDQEKGNEREDQGTLI